MLAKKIVRGKDSEELKQAFVEIEEWMETGVLKQDGVFKKIHIEFESELGFDQSMKVTEDAVLYEIARRFCEDLK